MFVCLQCWRNIYVNAHIFGMCLFTLSLTADAAHCSLKRGYPSDSQDASWHVIIRSVPAHFKARHFHIVQAFLPSSFFSFIILFSNNCRQRINNTHRNLVVDQRTKCLPCFGNVKRYVKWRLSPASLANHVLTMSSDRFRWKKIRTRKKKIWTCWRRIALSTSWPRLWRHPQTLALLMILGQDQSAPPSTMERLLQRRVFSSWLVPMQTPLTCPWWKYNKRLKLYEKAINTSSELPFSVSEVGQTRYPAVCHSLTELLRSRFERARSKAGKLCCSTWNPIRTKAWDSSIYPVRFATWSTTNLSEPRTPR